MDDGQIDVLLGFLEIVSHKFIGKYKEVKKIPIFCVCLKEHPLAKQKSVHINDLKQENLLLENLFIGPSNLSKLHSMILNERTADDALACIPMEGLPLLSFGAYYKTLKGNSLLKRFIELLKEHLFKT